MATKKYGYNQYKPDGQKGMDIVDAELNRYSPAFDYLSGFVTRSQNKAVDDDRDGTPGTPAQPGAPTPGDPGPGTPSPVTPGPSTPGPSTPGPSTPGPSTPGPSTPGPSTPGPSTPGPSTPGPSTPGPSTPGPSTPGPSTPGPGPPGPGTPGPGTPGPITPRFSDDFATEADAKNYISTFYKDKLGRDAKFGTTTDDTDASYWLNNLKSGKEDKASISSNILLNKEYTNPTTEAGGFLQDYSKKIADTAKQTESISTGVTKDASGTYDTANLTADQKAKFNAMSAGVKDTYAQTLNVADLSKTTTQTSDHIDSGAAKTSTIDQAIKDAYKLLGRQPDKSGYEYWAKELTKNPTFDLSKSFKLSKEYKDNNP